MAATDTMTMSIDDSEARAVRSSSAVPCAILSHDCKNSETRIRITKTIFIHCRPITRKAEYQKSGDARQKSGQSTPPNIPTPRDPRRSLGNRVPLTENRSLVSVLVSTTKHPDLLTLSRLSRSTDLFATVNGEMR